jgi:hypothetical protein
MAISIFPGILSEKCEAQAYGRQVVLDEHTEYYILGRAALSAIASERKQLYTLMIVVAFEQRSYSAYPSDSNGFCPPPNYINFIIFDQLLDYPRKALLPLDAIVSGKSRQS